MDAVIAGFHPTEREDALGALRNRGREATTTPAPVNPSEAGRTVERTKICNHRRH